MQRTATCCCGQATILVDGDPKIHLVCHCDNCKKRTGSAFGISAYFADTQIISKRGETKIYAIDTAKTMQERYFCPLCGTTLYWKIHRFTGMPNVEPVAIGNKVFTLRWTCWRSLPAFEMGVIPQGDVCTYPNILK